MSRVSTSATQVGAKALTEAKLLKTYRVTFCDARYFHHDVEAIDADAATAVAEGLNESGDTGADSGDPYIEWVETSELNPSPSSKKGGAR